MKKRKVAVFLCMVVTAGTLMMGCGGNTSDTTNADTIQTESEENFQAQSKPENQGEKDNEQREMGKVTAINGNEITIALVNRGKMPTRAEGEEGEMPERPEGEKGEAPERPEGENGKRAEGEAGKMEERPEGGRGQMSEDMFEETGETKTIIIEDESIIIKYENGEEVAGSLSDLAEGTLITLFYDENETLTQVMIGFGGRK